MLRKYVASLLVLSLLSLYSPSASLYGLDTLEITKENYERLLSNTIALSKLNAELSKKVTALESLIWNSNQELKRLRELQKSLETKIESLQIELKNSSDLLVQSNERLAKLQADLEKAEESYRIAYESFMKLQKEMEFKLKSKELETKILYGCLAVDSALAIVFFLLYVFK